MSVEGRAGNLYWEGVGLLIGDKVDFLQAGSTVEAVDPVNSLLNYGYGMLCRQAEGLDSGRPRSLWRVFARGPPPVN